MKNFIDLAKEAAAKLAEEFKNEPLLEFLAWLEIALQREAMVSEAYDASFVDSHLDAWRLKHSIPTETIDAIRRALMSVWAQESAHKSYFSAVLEEVSPAASLFGRIRTRTERVRGKLEGIILGSLMSSVTMGHRLAQLAIVIGIQVDAVPEYVKTLRKINFSEFCHVNGDLEHTAVIGYERMLALANKIRKAAIIEETTVIVDLKRTGADERYHETLFRALANWPPGGGEGQTVGVGPSTPPPIVSIVSVERAHELISSAKAAAYGPDAESIGDTQLEVDPRRISDDPFIRHIRRSFEEIVSTDDMLAGSI
jgi:hypothetical protein